MPFIFRDDLATIKMVNLRNYYSSLSRLIISNCVIMDCFSKIEGGEGRETKKKRNDQELTYPVDENR